MKFVDCALEMNFKERVEEMYVIDKKKLKKRRNFVNHQPEDDRLDIYYCRNLDPFMHKVSRQIKWLNNLARQVLRLQNDRACYALHISFNISENFDCIWREETLRSIITDLSKNVYQPFSLQHISAAAAIPELKKCEPHILLGVYTAVKNKGFAIRAGKIHQRKMFEFSTILKNYMYKHAHESLVDIAYFENLEKTASTAICFKCGLINYIKKNVCRCHMCDIMRFALVDTPIIEKSFHTNYCQN